MFLTPQYSPLFRGVHQSSMGWYLVLAQFSIVCGGLSLDDPNGTHLNMVRASVGVGRE